jgi:HTH-type transcriptional regulator, transcriptional repressor of NAD biosynthesis genes
VWSEKLSEMFPSVDVIFTSEPYGDFVAEYMGIDHVMYDEQRISDPISGTKIRNNPLLYRNYIMPAAQTYFVKKICIS